MSKHPYDILRGAALVAMDRIKARMVLADTYDEWYNIRRSLDRIDTEISKTLWPTEGESETEEGWEHHV